jgi:Tfp pilus assembly protein FimT
MINKTTFGLPRSRGITVIEILLIISLAAILLSFAIPSVGNAAARADLRAATENLQFSIDAARNSARRAESSIVLELESLADQSAQRITFSSPTGKGGRFAAERLQEYLVPESVLLSYDRDRFVFDERGIVELPGEILLVSREDDSIKTTLQVR